MMHQSETRFKFAGQLTGYSNTTLTYATVTDSNKPTTLKHYTQTTVKPKQPITSSGTTTPSSSQPMTAVTQNHVTTPGAEPAAVSVSTPSTTRRSTPSVAMTTSLPTTMTTPQRSSPASRRARHIHDIIIYDLLLVEHGITSLSILNGTHLLVTNTDNHHVFIHNIDTHNTTAVLLPDDDSLYDAVWTASGDIVYTSSRGHRAVVMTAEGERIHSTDIHLTGHLNRPTADSDVIYLASTDAGVRRSKDGGVTWSHVFHSADGSLIMQAVAVPIRVSAKQGGSSTSTSSNVTDVWTIEFKVNTTLGDPVHLTPFHDISKHVRVYTMASSTDHDDVITQVRWREVELPEDVDLLYCMLAYDGRDHMYLVDGEVKAVHVLTASSGRYEGQLLSSSDFDHNIPLSLAFADDSELGHLMYVGQGQEGIIGVYAI